MRKSAIFLCLLASAGLFAQEAVQTRYWKPETSQVGIPVRVFDGKTFVSDLALGDFELFENGVAQKLNAVFLMNKSTIERKEGQADIPPDAFRRFYVMIQATDYHPKLKNAVDYLFNEELKPGDSLDIQTPMRNYKMSSESLATKSQKTLANELNDIIRKDVGQGGMAYNTMLRDLKRLVRLISGISGTSLDDTEGDVEAFGAEAGGLERYLSEYKNTMVRMESLRQADDAKLVQFARSLKEVDGQKYVIYIYQREFRPEISSQTLNSLMMKNQDRYDIQGDIQELFTYYSRPFVVNYQKVDEAFADAGVDFNLLFILKQPERIMGITMREQSEDTFKALSQVSAATGGVVTTTVNPDSALKEMFQAANRNYILYFTPSAESKAAGFKKLEVRVKGKNYRIVTRSGYF
jgi:hypothetical protein